MVATVAFFRFIMTQKFKVVLFFHEVVRMKYIPERFQDTGLILKGELHDFLAIRFGKK